MTPQTLASQVAKREGKKSQARIGDIREILTKIEEIEAEIIASGSGAITPTEIIRERADKRADKLFKRQLKLNKGKAK